MHTYICIYLYTYIDWNNHKTHSIFYMVKLFISKYKNMYHIRIECVQRKLVTFKDFNVCNSLNCIKYLIAKFDKWEMGRFRVFYG